MHCAVLDEMADDAPFLVSHLQAEFAAAVATAENARILATFNATSGILTGTGATATVVDVVADAIAAAEAFSGKTPTAVVAHPNVIAAIRKAKASTAGLHGRPDRARSVHAARGAAHLHPGHGCRRRVGDRGQRRDRSSGVDRCRFRSAPTPTTWPTTRDDGREERVGAAVTRPCSLTKLTLS